MSHVIFQNKGTVDLRAIKTFGLSAKEGTNPIGFFGTGLKYAIAILMREGIDLSLVAGGVTYKFEKSAIDMRGKDFEIITMNGVELPFTTELGKNWELWKAFRELYCNCTDESGSIFSSESYPETFVAEQTTFIATGESFSNIFNEKYKYILSLPDSLRLMNNKLQVYREKNESVFYRGIKVLDLPKPSKFTYNFTETVALTEDRTVKDTSETWRRLSVLCAGSTDSRFIKEILLMGNDHIESDFTYDHLTYQQSAISPVFMEVLEDCYRKNHDNLNQSAIRLYLYLTKTKDPKHLEDYQLTDVQEKQLKRACSILNEVFPDFLNYKIRTVVNLGQSTMAMADTDEEIMIISKKCFQSGTKYLVSTLIEEYLHIKSGHGDLTRSFQTAIFDTMCTIIEEHVIEEAM